MATFLCGGCGHEKATSDKHIGRTAKCPKCHQSSVVQAVVQSPRSWDVTPPPIARIQPPPAQTYHFLEGGRMPRQSQAFPAFLSFLFPGLGQLCQGRLGSAVGWCLAMLMSILLITVVVGLILCPAVWVMCIMDAAKYNPAD